LLAWCIRQAIAVAVLAVVIRKWPNYWWLVFIWIGAAGLSLFVIIRGFGKLQHSVEELEQKL